MSARHPGPPTPAPRDRPPEPGPVRAFEFPVVERRRLPNRLAFLAARHGDLPLVTARLLVDAGAATEPAAQAGIAQLTARALEAGTATRDAGSLAWELELLGASLEAHAGWDAAHLELTVPRERLEPALELLAEVVCHPGFPEDEVGRLRDEQRAEILQRRKEPRALAGDMATRFIFAGDTPYARPLVGYDETVAELGAAAVAAHHRRAYGAAAAALILTGDVDAASAEPLVARHFGGWDARPEPLPHVAVEGAIQETTVFVVDRPGAVQSEIRIGHVGVARDHPDFFALEVMNTLLGGAFTSRLNMNLRERNGFTYGARSGFSYRRMPGPFVVQAAVATDVTAAAVREALSEIHGLRDEGPTDAEVEAARDYLTGVLPLTLQTTEQLAARLAALVVHQLPDDYFQHYRDGIAAISRAQAHAAARDHIHPDRMAIVVVGAADEIAPALEELDLGPVHIHRNGGNR
jgi:zinc protease